MTLGAIAKEMRMSPETVRRLLKCNPDNKMAQALSTRGPKKKITAQHEAFLTSKKTL